jgi:hypothetical protein
MMASTANAHNVTSLTLDDLTLTEQCGSRPSIWLCNGSITVRNV